MRENLPYLNQSRLDAIFNNVYHMANTDIETKELYEDEKIADLAGVLFKMQEFNYQYRPDDTRALFGLMSKIFDFEINSEGTTLWLSLILALKELYGFSDKTMLEVMSQLKIRK